ncbi:Cupin 2 conserved barrel domain protein [Spirochaeta thermophila DSM 6578]|uniref:Cupin 2 conserved barrel domain protein n=1 Tax=Winmispira thermophila (strain ATCC 700085 / DSM 6578 / Z-1203) TaxID=869211 RepID=G0GA68_WINT7|nr:cupin domain-containing protein [Spirochaeta thermophila]AEJ60904.1 Cupin 2 conserved barrel domain protein [Spirochaeta thermophila DSM 6578]
MAEPVNLDLTVQEGAVVSKTLLERPSGSLTLFAFGKGQRLSPHSAPYDAYIVLLEGRLSVTVGEETATLTAGTGILMPAMVLHALEALEDSRFLLVMLKA